MPPKRHKVPTMSKGKVTRKRVPAESKGKVTTKKVPKPIVTRSATSEVPAKTVKTKGGNYPVYQKKSATAQSFREAFRSARKSGAEIFTWRGRKYTTKIKGE